MSQFDLLIFIGRFQPFHNGHLNRIQRALACARRVLVLVGSTNRARSPRNPFSYGEREMMIRSCLTAEEKERTDFYPLNDYMYNDTAWMTEVREIVGNIVPMTVTNFPRLDSAGLRGANAVGRAQLGATDIVTHEGRKIGIIGFDRDHTSWYLNVFGEWEVFEPNVEYGPFNSSEIRRNYFQHMILPNGLVPHPIFEWLSAFMVSHHYKRLVQENKYNTHYQDTAHLTYAPMWMTVDPVVVQSGHILLVERGELPGKGLRAFPGGFVDEDELLIDAVVRELKEETGISDGKGTIPPAMLKSWITKQEIFDDPHRSERGRVITCAYLFELPARQKLFEVKGGSDARTATWYPISDIKGSMMFEDHYFIMNKLLGLTS